MSIFLYILTVLIWGTTWFAISLQLGSVPVAQSIAYRFALASFVLFLGLFILRRRMHLPKETHLRLLGQGVCLFSLNFICFYYATERIPSGLVSVVFSLATILNVLNNRLLFGVAISPKAIFGGLLGLSGLALLLIPTLDGQTTLQDVIIGLALAFCGTYCFSLGNMIGKWNAANNVDTATGNAYAMLYGASALFGFTLFLGQPLTIDLSLSYMGALVYLAIPGSVIGFTAYLSLVGRIGPEKAAYSTVLFPVIALFFSSLFEGYEWNLIAVVGLVIVIMGNVIVFTPPSLLRRCLPRKPTIV